MKVVESLKRFLVKLLKLDDSYKIGTDHSGDVIIRSESAAEKIKTASLELHHNDWVSLNHISCPKDKIINYVYSTETKCNGKIVSFVPFKNKGNGIQFLIRCEATPCWDYVNQVPSSFTGCVEKGESPLETVIRELKEEAGYIVNQNNIINLGQVFGSKSSDTIYFLFGVDLTESQDPGIIEIENELEKSAYNVWIDINDSFEISDSLFNCVCYRLLNFLKMVKD